MPIKDKLNSAWSTNETMDAVFEFRAVAENAYNVLQETIARIDQIAAGASFAGVDSEIKIVGQAVRKILNDAKNLLDGYKDFTLWRQPK